MFGTLHTSSEGEEPAFITQHIGRRAENGSVCIHKYAACDACRAKKLRCSSQRAGCTRCRAASIKCVYSDTNFGRGRKRKSVATADQPSGDLTQANASDNNGVLSTSIGSIPPNSPHRRRRATGDSELVGAIPPDHESNSSSPSGLCTPNNGYDSTDYFLDFNLADFPVSLGSGNMGLEPFTFPQDDLLADDTTTPIDYQLRSKGYSSAQFQSTLSPLGQEFSERYDFHSPTHSSLAWLPQTPVLTPPTSGCSSASSDVPSTAICKGNKCSRKAVELLEEVRSSTSNICETSVPWALSFHKTALSQCNELIKCPLCPAKGEYILLLALLVQELALQSEKMIIASLGRGTPADNQFVTLFGSYTIDTPEEGEAIMRTLLYVNLRSLATSILRLKAMASPDEAHYSIITKTEMKVLDLSGLVNKI